MKQIIQKKADPPTNLGITVSERAARRMALSDVSDPEETRELRWKRQQGKNEQLKILNHCSHPPYQPHSAVWHLRRSGRPSVLSSRSRNGSEGTAAPCIICGD